MEKKMNKKLITNELRKIARSIEADAKSQINKKVKGVEINQ